MSDPTSVKLNAFAAVFTVSDVARAIAFYRDRLGFRVEFAMGDPPSYAIIERDNVQLHLMPVTQSPASLGHSTIYVFVSDVDRLHEQLAAAGCPIESPPKDYPYGMRECSVVDPDGNRVAFGQEVKPAQAAG